MKKALKTIFFLLTIMIGFFFHGFAFGEEELEVTGIIHSETPVAIVNSQFVREGDEIEGRIVEKIDKESVTFRYGEEIIVKSLGKSESTEPAEAKESEKPVEKSKSEKSSKKSKHTKKKPEIPQDIQREIDAMERGGPEDIPFPH